MTVIAWQKIIAFFAAAVIFAYAILNVDPAPDGETDVRLVLDVPGRGKFETNYGCGELASADSSISSGIAPVFRTITFRKNDLTLILSTANVPSAFCRKGRYAGISDISGPFNLVEIVKSGRPDEALFVRHSSNLGKGEGNALHVLEISASPSGATKSKNAMAAAVAFHREDFAVRYASVPIIELSIRPSGDAMTRENFAATMTELRAQLRRGASAAGLPAASLCALSDADISRIFEGVGPDDARRDILAPFRSCLQNSNRNLVGRRKANFESSLGRIRSAKLRSTGDWIYDRGGSPGDGILISCNLPIEYCREKNLNLDGQNLANISVNNGVRSEEVSVSGGAYRAFYIDDADYRDSIIFASNKLYEFDLGGVI